MTGEYVSTHRKGARGEEIAAAYLVERGWTILDRNYRTRYAEIDIVAGLGDTLAFVEVKTWGTYSRRDLGSSVDGRKQARIARAARWYLAGRPDLSDRHMRFDVVFIDARGGGIEHFADAWTGEGID
jgi:putative endonuclease